jgi:DNA invertase Pin-like site-specific DNA recombinase
MSSTRIITRQAGTAIYLRCYPADRWEMVLHRHALEDLAERTGFASPGLYFDNGISSDTHGPRLRDLLAAVAAGHVKTVLVPGAWVFSLCPRAAQDIWERIRAAGVQLVEMPSPRAALEERRVPQAA